MNVTVKTYESARARGLKCIQFIAWNFEGAWKDFLWWQNDENDLKTSVKIISCSHAIGPDGKDHLTFFYTCEYD